MFSTATFYSLVWVTAYEDPYDLTVDTSVFPPAPITYVSPGAARTRLNGELSRNSILLVAGTKLPRAPNFPIFFEGSQGDPMIITDGLDSFDVSLMDVKGNPISDGEFQISLCPVLDHRAGPTWGQVDTRPCPPNLVSSNGVIPNVTPIDRGYMGLMVSRAPSAPGVYFFLIKPSPSNTRAWRTGPSLNPLVIYTYAVTVRGGQFLDDNFHQTDPFVVDQDTIAYFRYTDNGLGPPPSTVTIQSQGAGNTAETASIDVMLTRVGQSTNYLAGPFTLHPPVPVAPTGIKAVASRQTSSVLDVFGPLSKLKAFFAPEQVGQADAVLNGMSVKVEWLPRGDQAYLPQGSTQGVYSMLKPGRQAYLGDGLRLTAQFPTGWPTPVSYQWDLKVDGQPYAPDGVNLAGATLTFDPIQKLGTWKVHVTATFPSGAVRESPERPVYVWLETEPEAAIGWIDARQIDTTIYQGTTGSLIGDCNKMNQFFADVLLNVSTYNFPQPPPAAERPFYNAAALRCIGPSPDISINQARFETLSDLLAYWDSDWSTNYKQGVASYFQVPVILGRPQMTLLRTLIRESHSGWTAPNVADLTFPPFPSEKGPGDKTISRADVGSAKTFYLLHKSRVGLPARLVACFINTGNPICDEDRWVPYVWIKLINAADGPSLRLDLQRSHTSFPSFQYYVPEQRSLGLRKFPLVRIDLNLIPQAPNPNTFINNPENSNENN